MSDIIISDPLELLPYQSGIAGEELKQEAAKSNTSLDVRQRAIQIGEPIPIVFCRRVTVSGTDIGGVFAAPGCTSGRFENDSTTNALTVNFQLVLSQGQIGDIPEKNLYQRACRVGTWKRSYNQRASSWVPGYHITTVANKEPWICPSYCGTDGKFTNLTALSYTNVHADNDKTWDRQVYVFVKDGLKITRLLDNTLGSSNNFIDLAIYLIKQSNRLPDDLIDTASMTVAANFLNVNKFFCNGVFEGSENLEEWLTNTGNQFLLRLSEKNGKKYFRPRLPLNADYTINSTSALNYVFAFSEDHIVEGSFQIEYIPLIERQNACAVVLWKQQPDNDLPIIRSAEIKQANATDPVLIQYDLSQWCCSEEHAVKFGALMVAQRKYMNHTLRISVRPGTFNATLALGDIVRVKLRRETNVGTVNKHDHLYEVERINKSVSGVIELDLIHHPVDLNKVSIIAQCVAAATPVGTVLPTGRNDLTCHVNTSSSNIADDGISYPYSGFPVIGSTSVSFGDFNEAFDDDFPFDEDLGNAVDPFEEDFNTSIADDQTGTDPLQEGTTLTASGAACVGGKVCWYKYKRISSIFEAPVWGDKQLIGCSDTDTGSATLLTNSDMVDHKIVAESSCPDPSTDDGFGTPNIIGETEPLEIDPTKYAYARWVGHKVLHYPESVTPFIAGVGGTTIPASTNKVSMASAWYQITSYDSEGNVTSSNYLTLSGAWNCAAGGAAQHPVSASSVYYPEHGPVPWRANVRVTHKFLATGGLNASFGALGVGNNGTACNGASPGTRFYSDTGGRYISLEGKWEFSNDTAYSKTVDKTWQGRRGDNDGIPDEDGNQPGV